MGLILGLILLFTKQAKLHRLLKKKQTFQVYVKDNYDISEVYANCLAAAAVSWMPIADEPVQPASLDSLRPLKRLSTAEQKLEAWRIAVSASGPGAPDAKQVQRAVRIVLGEQPPVPKQSKLQQLAAEVLDLINRQQISAARSRLSQELPADVKQPADAPAPAEAPAIPVLTYVVEPDGIDNAYLYNGPDCEVRRQGDILVVVAHPKYRESMVSHGLQPTGVDGEWILRTKGKRAFDANSFIESLRESLKQSLLPEVANA
ncbi:hypothetical protein [Lacunisphaera limnophila]|uniref:hypothetical protein n=1 Tax=Lacunisphaera limnophila TaxID=1838286 RepID=UPI0012FD413F|nr:hypothetical protein [Lacunisphaera limnophila]